MIWILARHICQQGKPEKMQYTSKNRSHLLSSSLDRKHIVKIALSSALTSLGKDTDQNSTWAEKLNEVRAILAQLLPMKLAAELYDLYVIHVRYMLTYPLLFFGGNATSILFRIQANLIRASASTTKSNRCVFLDCITKYVFVSLKPNWSWEVLILFRR